MNPPGYTDEQVTDLFHAFGSDELDRVADRVGFDLKGLKAKGIQGQLLGAPALIDVQTDKSGVTTLAAALRRIDVRALDELAPGALSRVRGAAAIKAAVAVPPLHSRGKLSLRLDSDLKGVAIDLPAPVGKAADAARPLAVELGFAPEGPIAARPGSAATSTSPPSSTQRTAGLCARL